MKPLLVLLIFVQVCAGQNLPVVAVDSNVALSINDPAVTARFDRTDVRRLPYRTLDQFLSLVPGIVNLNGGLHVRGSRGGEIGYSLDGVSVTNRYLQTNGVELLPEAIDRIDVYTGFRRAALGGGNGGLVSQRMRTGGDSLEISFNVLSDHIVATGSQILNTTSFGATTVAATAGGPVIDRLKFFIAGEYQYQQNRQPMYLEPFRIDDLTVTWSQWGKPLGMPLPGPVEIRRNYLPDNWLKRTTMQGSLAFGFDEWLQLKLLGSTMHATKPSGTEWPVMLQNIFNLERAKHTEEQSDFIALTAETQVTPWLSGSAAVSWFARSRRTYDPDFGDEWWKYADSAENARIGWTGFVSRYSAPRDYMVVDYFRFKTPGAPNNSYDKDAQSVLQYNASILMQPLDMWSINIGGGIEQWVVRRFAVGDIARYLEDLDWNRDGKVDAPLTEYSGMNLGKISTYGYTAQGKETNEGDFAPYEPVFSHLYLENSITVEGTTINVGGRWERADLQSPDIGMDYDYMWGYMRSVGAWDYPSTELFFPQRLKKRGTMEIFLPRISIESQVAEHSWLAVSYGRFAVIAPLQLILPTGQMLRDVFLWNYQTMFAPISDHSFLLGYEKSEILEIGGSRQLEGGQNLSLRIYSKRMYDQSEFGIVDTSNPGSYWGFLNRGSGKTQGVEATLSSSTNEHVSWSLGYALSVAEGTTSRPEDAKWTYYGYNSWYVYRRPIVALTSAPLEYQQRHRVVGRFSFFSGPGDRLWDNWRLDVVGSAASGHPYSRFAELQDIAHGASFTMGVIQLQHAYQMATPSLPRNIDVSPWTYSVDLRFTKEAKVGPVNLTFSLNIFNLFDTKNINNVYPVTGDKSIDGWLASDLSAPYRAIPEYEKLYSAINRDNRWAYMSVTGNEMYGPPRQFRLGLSATY